MKPQPERFEPTHDVLAHSHGFEVIAADGPVGVVETPLFPPHTDEPDYLIVRTESTPQARFRVVSVALVRCVDAAEARIHLTASRRMLTTLPEELPIAFPWA